MNQSFMKEKNILPLVLSMSLPMVVSMAVNSLYNIVDSYFVAKLSEDAITALALVYPIQNLITAIAVGFGVGINARVSYHLGAQEPDAASRAATQGLFLNLLHGILLSIFCISLMPAFLKMFTSDTAVLNLSLTYSIRAFFFAPVITLGISYEKIFQSTGRMKTTMFCMMCGFAANIILDPLMIFGIGIFPAMGIAGAAYATGIGQCLTFIAYLFFCFLRPLPVHIEKKHLCPDKDIIKKLYEIGIPATLNMALSSFLISALNGILAGFSQKYVLILGVYYKLQTFIYLTANGIVQGIRPLIGYNYGAKEYERIKKIFTVSLSLTAAVMLTGTLLSWTVPQSLIGLFTKSPDTLPMAVTALRIISLGFIVSSVSVTCSGVLEGLGKGLPSLCIALSRYVAVMIPAAWIASRIMGANGVWAAFSITETITALFSFFIYRNQTNFISAKQQKDKEF